MKSRFQELAEIWIKKASDDFLWAKHGFQGKFYGSACFICQQVAEKALKAYLFSKKEKLIKTHNLIALLRKCKKQDCLFEKLLPACKVLNNYYTDTRYPDIWDYSRFED